MQIASTSYSAEDWNTATSSGGPVVGDIVWKLANTLWRTFAQVRLDMARQQGGADNLSVNYIPKQPSSYGHSPPYRQRRISV